MPKGRSSNPSIDNDGNWYKHRNCTEFMNIGPRTLSTSTGFMLHREKTELRPTDPPKSFTEKHQQLDTKENPFSTMDNRNNIQLKGEYLGDGRDTRTLGRRLYPEKNSLHRTPTDYMKHRSLRTDPLYTQHNAGGDDQTFFHSNYMLSHQYQPGSAAERRRFPRKHNEPPTGNQDLSTTTVKQFSASKGELPYRTHNQTLVSSIEPFLKHNAWKYAYNGNGKHDIYPKVWGDRCSVHIPNARFLKRQVLVNRIARECTM